MAAVSTAYLAGSARAEAEVAHATPIPADVGRKFFANGQVRPFAGNTLICHAPQQGERSAYFNALLDIYREATVLPFAHKIAFTPPSSYHMTIFGGANDQDRRPGLWPGALPLDAPMETCDQWMAEQLKAFFLDCALPLRMKVDLAPPVEAPFVLRLIPCDDAENARLRKLISRLADTLQIFPKDIDTYRFHTTLGYSIQWLDDKEDAMFQALMAKWRRDVAAKSPQILMGAPEFCIFKDMFAFQRQFYLS
jgi:hypothetical protein